MHFCCAFTFSIPASRVSCMYGLFINTWYALLTCSVVTNLRYTNSFIYCFQTLVWILVDKALQGDCLRLYLNHFANECKSPRGALWLNICMWGESYKRVFDKSSEDLSTVSMFISFLITNYLFDSVPMTVSFQFSFVLSLVERDWLADKSMLRQPSRIFPIETQSKSLVSIICLFNLFDNERKILIVLFAFYSEVLNDRFVNLDALFFLWCLSLPCWYSTFSS